MISASTSAPTRSSIIASRLAETRQGAHPGQGCDVVFEHVGPATWERLHARARAPWPAGDLRWDHGTEGEVTLPHLFMKNQSVLGSTMGPRAALPEILQRVAEGASARGRSRPAHRRDPGGAPAARRPPGVRQARPDLLIRRTQPMSDTNAASIERAAVLGAGTMGHGIAQVLAVRRRDRLFDVSEEAVAERPRQGRGQPRQGRGAWQGHRGRARGGPGGSPAPRSSTRRSRERRRLSRRSPSAWSSRPGSSESSGRSWTRRCCSRRTRRLSRSPRSRTPRVIPSEWWACTSSTRCTS